MISQRLILYISDLNNEGRGLLPFDVELQLYALYDITRNILVITLISLVMYYGWTRSAQDETWVERKFASFFTLSVIAWLALTFLIPFLALSILHPNLALEIGGRILYDLRFAMVLLMVFIVIIQVLNYKGYFRKKD